ncbi:hypothetical protein [Anaerorhabdus sp.]|uniref:hypothetical protein n=1 Tax=Anaerorhabdus sp. TaxID=1872524 RepID=UPI002FCA5293
MNRFEEGVELIESTCGNNKDNVISISTMELEPSSNGKPYAKIREVDAHYEDGVFYITTYGLSNKMKQIVNNNVVSFSVCFEGITGIGIGENLGWVLDPKNADIRAKVRKTFADWYDAANNEQDENCVILAIHITKATIFKDHGATVYNLDFENKKEI